MILVSLQSIKYHFLIPTAMKLDEKTYLQLVCRFYLKIKFNTFHFTNFIYFNVIFFSALILHIVLFVTIYPIVLFTTNPLIFSNSNCLLYFLITLWILYLLFSYFLTVIIISFLLPTLFSLKPWKHVLVHSYPRWFQNKLTVLLCNMTYSRSQRNISKTNTP